MPDLIKIRKGNKDKIPVLQDGELGYSKDTNELYIGTQLGNKKPNQGDIDKINSEIDRIDVQLAETMEKTETEIRKTQNNPTNFNGAIVTFIDDDTGQYVPEIWGTIIANKGIEMGFAVPTNYADGTVTPSSPQLKPMAMSYLQTLYDNGHDIYSHSHTHPAFYSDTTTLSMIEDECINSQKWLKEHGFTRNADIIVYPGGLGQTKVDKKNIIRKYYKYGIDTYPNTNPDIIDNWCVYRVNADTSTLEQLKAHVDYAHARGLWLVFMNHAYEMYPDKINQITKIESLIDYIRSFDIPIMKFSEAVKYKGNVVALGEYTSQNNIFINPNAKAKGLATFETGDWSPTLIGSSISGSHTYATRKGTYSRIGNMVTVSFNIRIDYTSLDSVMSGSLRITGLPFIRSANEQGSKGTLEYNHLTLGTNYTHAIVSVGGLDYLSLLKQGNGVNTSFLTKSDLTSSQVIVLSGQVTYRIAE